jgi:hypothetical protein
MTYENGIFQSGLQEKREPCVMAKMEFYELVRLIILAVRTQTHTPSLLHFPPALHFMVLARI